MRIWDLHPSKLCRVHLFGEHNELHIMWRTITEGRKGWANHPETNRWRGKLKALWNRHFDLVEEMFARGYSGHKTDLDISLATGSAVQDEFLCSLQEQEDMLIAKSKDPKTKCECEKYLWYIEEGV